MQSLTLIVLAMLPFAAVMPSRGAYKLPVRTMKDMRRSATVAPMLLPEWSAPKAAREFVAWLRVHGEIGQHSTRRITTLYAEFCEAQSRTPTADNMLLEALKDVHGVTKAQAKGLKKKGKRTRPAVWTIAAVAEVKRRRRA